MCVPPDCQFPSRLNLGPSLLPAQEADTFAGMIVLAADDMAERQVEEAEAQVEAVSAQLAKDSATASASAPTTGADVPAANRASRRAAKRKKAKQTKRRQADGS